MEDYFYRIKKLAKAQNKTIEFVVEKAGLTLPSYNSYRRLGNLPRADESELIAAELGTTNTYLVTGKDPAKPDVSDAIKKIETALDDLRKL